MSIAIMAQVWPLEIPTTDKMVLLALADAANDEGHTWIAVKSKIAFNRSGLPKLNLLLKTSLRERAIQMALRRLEYAGHISREEKPGIGVDYWVHPLTLAQGETPAPHAPPQDVRPASHAATPARAAGDPRTTCAQIIKNPKQPPAGARAQAPLEQRLRSKSPSGSAPLALRILAPVAEQCDEGDRERCVRAAIAARAGRLPAWLQRGAIRVGELSNEGSIGLTVLVAPADRSFVDGLTGRLAVDAAEALGVAVAWVAVEHGTALPRPNRTPDCAAS